MPTSQRAVARRVIALKAAGVVVALVGLTSRHKIRNASFKGQMMPDPFSRLARV